MKIKCDFVLTTYFKIPGQSLMKNIIIFIHTLVMCQTNSVSVTYQLYFLITYDTDFFPFLHK